MILIVVLAVLIARVVIITAKIITIIRYRLQARCLDEIAGLNGERLPPNHGNTAIFCYEGFRVYGLGLDWVSTIGTINTMSSILSVSNIFMFRMISTGSFPLTATVLEGVLFCGYYTPFSHCGYCKGE